MGFINQKAALGGHHPGCLMAHFHRKGVFESSEWDAHQLPLLTGWGPQDSVQLVYKWLNSMVYGRYNYSIHGGYNGL